MRKSFIILLAIVGLFFSNPLSAQSNASIEYSSVDAFFSLTDKIAKGKEPTEKKWSELFDTQGYRKCIDETFDEREMLTREAMTLAYSPAKAAERDYIMNTPIVDVIADGEALLLSVMLRNFLDMKEKQSIIKKQLRAMNVAELQLKARRRLKSFLVNPIDSLITPIPVSLLCMEPDALSLSAGIVWDCNLFFIQTEEERVDLLAHEMFHTYRRHFVEEKRAAPLLKIIYNWHNEGIADLIDKKTLSDLSSAFSRYGLPESYVDTYNEIYQSTPQTVKELEKLTLSFLHNEITEKDFNSKLSGFFQYGGHPNGYYMTTLIKSAGFEKELIATFDSPVEFMKLYNRSVVKEYVLGSEFMDYIEKIK